MVKLCMAAMLLWGILLAGRGVFALLYSSASELMSHRASWLLAAFNAFRFDMQVLAYALLLPTVVALAMFGLCKSANGCGSFRRFCQIYFVVAAILVLLVEIIDIGYCYNFGTHIGITFFDFFNEGPIGLLQVMWEDYPAGWLLVLLAAVGVAAWWAVGRIFRKERQHSAWIVPIFVALLVCAMRGSLGRFPLQVEDTVVSPSQQLNAQVPNGLYMLKKAWSDKRKAFRFETADELISNHGFSSIGEALDAWSDGSLPLNADTLATLQKALFGKSVSSDPKATFRPNILIIMSESWSGWLCQMGKQYPQLLCSLQKHLGEDMLWQQFQSVRNGTIGTIETMVCATPFPRFFTSRYRDRLLPSAITEPFHQSGYTCEFITGMDQGWENCGMALKAQHFDRITGKYELLSEHPEYGCNAVGIYDHHLFQSILERLTKRPHSARPLMMLAMTTTNHPPFVYPDDISLPALPDSFYSLPCFAEHRRDVLQKYIDGFQYYNQSLARLLDQLKASPAADSTIIVVTGDHNVRSIIDYSQVGREWQHAVPLYIYLPPSLRPDGYPAHPDAWGCHYDILPTIAPYAFTPETQFMRLGTNLLDTAAFHYSYNEALTLARPEQLAKAQRKASVLDLLLKLYFQMVWK